MNSSQTFETSHSLSWEEKGFWCIVYVPKMMSYIAVKQSLELAVVVRWRVSPQNATQFVLDGILWCYNKMVDLDIAANEYEFLILLVLNCVWKKMRDHQGTTLWACCKLMMGEEMGKVGNGNGSIGTGTGGMCTRTESGICGHKSEVGGAPTMTATSWWTGTGDAAAAASTLIISIGDSATRLDLKTLSHKYMIMTHVVASAICIQASVISSV